MAIGKNSFNILILKDDICDKVSLFGIYKISNNIRPCFAQMCYHIRTFSFIKRTIFMIFDINLDAK